MARKILLTILITICLLLPIYEIEGGSPSRAMEGSIGGIVKDDLGAPISGVKVVLSNLDMNLTTTTDLLGTYNFNNVTAGNYSIDFTRDFYSPLNETIAVNGTSVSYMNVTLRSTWTGGIRGRALTEGGVPVSDAVIHLENNTGKVAYDHTDNGGYFSFMGLEMGAYVIWAFAEVYGPTEESLVAVFKSEWTEMELVFHDYLITVVTDPMDGQVNVSLEEYFMIEFSESMNLTYFTDEYISLKEVPSGFNILFFIQPYDFYPDRPVNTTFALGILNDLDHNTTYELEFSKDVLSIDGIPLGRDIVISFTTIPDLADLTILSYYPDPEIHDVPVDVIPYFTVNEPLDASTINSVNINLINARGINVYAEVSLSEDLRTVFIDPFYDLQMNEYYILYLSSEVKTITPGYKVQTFHWSFQVQNLVPNGSLTGRVVDEDGDPIDPDMIDIRITRGSVQQMPDVNFDGVFTQEDLATGIWTIKFSAFGYHDYTTIETISENETLDMGTIILFKDETEETWSDGFDMNDREMLGCMCSLLLLITVIILMGMNLSVKKGRKKDREKIEKLESLALVNEE